MNFSSDLVLKLQEELRASRAHTHKLLKRNAELEIVTDNTQVIINLEKRVAELEECLEEYLKASTSVYVYSTSRELGAAETKASSLLEK